jgi:hypothetical protein
MLFPWVEARDISAGNVQSTPNSALQRGNKKVQTFVCILSLYLFHSGWPLLVIMQRTIKIQFLTQVGDDGGVYVLDMHWDSLPQGSPMDLYHSPMGVDFSQAEGTRTHNNPDKSNSSKIASRTIGSKLLLSLQADHATH